MLLVLIGASKRHLYLYILKLFFFYNFMPGHERSYIRFSTVNATGIKIDFIFWWGHSQILNINAIRLGDQNMAAVCMWTQQCMLFSIAWAKGHSLRESISTRDNFIVCSWRSCWVKRYKVCQENGESQLAMRSVLQFAPPEPYIKATKSQEKTSACLW
jgi:hypothetical protein